MEVESVPSETESKSAIGFFPSISKPKFEPLKAHEISEGKVQFRKVSVPPHRYSPLKKAWMDLYTPIYEQMKVDIRMNLKARKVELKTRADTPDVSNLQKSADFIHAFMLGFEVLDAIALLRMDELYVDSFEIKDVKTLRGEHLSRAIGRLSGKGGKTRFAIENSTRTRIVIADSRIHILGSFSNNKVARDSLCSLILGSPAGKVYSKLRSSCCRRAISTTNIHSVLAVLSGAMNLLGNEYQEALQQKIREPNLGPELFLGGVGVQKTGTEIATALNNMDVSSKDVLKLRHEIEEQCVEVFPAPADREKVKSCLSELGEMTTSFKQALNAGMEQLVATVTPRIRPVLDVVTTISYELSEAEYAENEVNDPWVQKLLHAVETNAAWLQPAMTSSNYDSFVHLVIDFIVKRLEVIMMQKRFSQLGGLQLDRDARALVSHFSSMTQRTVRDKFARLTQMATILNLEKVSEILDFWGENSGPMTWRLTPAEVRRVLGLRVDFKPEAIAALRL